MNPRRLLLWTSIVLSLGAVSGCATVYEGQFAFNDGWRKAKVEKVGSASTLDAMSASDCRGVAPADGFALVSYADFGHLRRRIVALPSHTRFEAGDAVYIKLRSCSGDVARQRALSR
ncbi:MULTISPECIES: hypothetical protein [unclassified Variovorax]|jgi:hypothetical protein|uniref:hypothetical protein n=1 Tax=unclassified Variovorax TaxID=663243 RepID=UPI000F7F0E00|nr:MULTISPECIES: hypothetical protein [unclassified Variovorax]RSZ44088.1 hypothetical protein EJO70_09155 [Variovorax sp. 553]RSZ45257.1 hypothetical protein EJO71_08685 [Variovorax sp. 679]